MLAWSWNAAVDIVRGDLLEWGRRYDHGIERNAAWDAGFESGTETWTREGFTFIAFKISRARGKEMKMNAATGLLLQ